MKVEEILLLHLFILSAMKEKVSAFRCFTCQGGYKSPCAQAIALAGHLQLCEGINAQCYESIKYFQRGVIKLVDRKCWIPDKKSKTSNYCTSFNNPNGQLIRCRTCGTDNCNTHRFGTSGLNDLDRPSNFTDFHYVGSYPAE